MRMLATMSDVTAADPLLIECDTTEGVIARCNVLIGLWAARRLCLTGTDAEAYVWAVHFADQGEAGHDDVVDRQTTPDLVLADAAPICRPYVKAAQRVLRAREA